MSGPPRGGTKETRIPVHPQKVFLDVIGPAEGLVADVAVEGLLLAVDVLVAGVEVPPVGAVGAVEAGVPLAAGVARGDARPGRGPGHRRRRRAGRHRRRALHKGTAAV